ncbi:hypothetical protein, partial [Streptomyces lunaelactis]|uniref:hypothetical protein n=1 Tax=Streptomyces lunaelactis TaxID=1535768 RepID=UPI001C2F1196
MRQPRCGAVVEGRIRGEVAILPPAGGHGSAQAAGGRRQGAARRRDAAADTHAAGALGRGRG